MSSDACDSKGSGKVSPARMRQQRFGNVSCVRQSLFSESLGMPFKLIRKERSKTDEGRKMGSCILETRGLVKRFGRGSREQTAVDGVSLHVEEGKVYGLLGPNGAGKSTTLKMITGMLRPSEGQILFEQRPWQRSDLYRIGSLVEQPPLYPNLTARENMRVRTTMLGLPDERIDEVLSTVGLADTGTKRADRFSMGMKQRLGIALALLTQPKLLILDEPTNGLDPIGIEELRIIIREFPKHGITVLLSSHILNEVQQTADSVGIIVNGRLAYEGALQKEQDLEALFMEVCRNGDAR